MIEIPVSFTHGRQESGLFPFAFTLLPVLYVAGNPKETTRFYQALFSFRLALRGKLC
jgi:hypothetical protein